ncbi:MAG: patatin-like phospholipase family protein [Dehalococcoidia bacterium]
MQAEHTPHGTPPEGYGGPRRALILAGGGIRLSYQAGALRALTEQGLCFSHIDGTSGGAVNAAMLLSGLTPEEMCDRWRTLDIRGFLSLMPFENYLRVRNLQALGDANGIVSDVFPHLGIDVEKVNAARGIDATFNVFNYTNKVNEVFTHREMDVDLLVAGMSLPGVLPPVKRGENLYLDSAFVRDANPVEAIRRGAEELWIVWCLRNTPEYRGGPVDLYVQTLEMSAVGALHEDFAAIRDINERITNGEAVYGHTSPIRLHMVLPRQPLPQDTDLYFGSVDHGTLLDMGYADARRYLQSMDANGLPFTPEVTKMESSEPGITFRETMAGGFSLGATDPDDGKKRGDDAGTKLAMHASINISDVHRFIEDPQHSGEITGHIDFTPFGQNIPAKRGVFNLFSPTDEPDLKWMVYELAFDWEGKEYYLAGRKEVRNDRGVDLWKDTTTLLTTLHEGPDATGPVAGAGVLTLGADDLVRLSATVRVTNASSTGQQAAALSAFGRFFMGELWDSYANRLQAPVSWWRRLWQKIFGKSS